MLEKIELVEKLKTLSVDRLENLLHSEKINFIENKFEVEMFIKNIIKNKRGKKC